MSVSTEVRQIVHQRSHGAAAAGLVLVDGRARLKELRQEGSAKVLLPHVGGAVPEMVFLNTSGGLASGDRLSYRLDLGPGVRAVATTQTAERAYRATGSPAEVAAEVRVGAGGWLDWLPQETILFDGARLDRRTRIELGEGAGCLLLETVILGRAAMGETVARVALSDLRLISRAGRPVFMERLRLDDATLGRGAAVLGTARAFASVVLVDARAEDRLGAVRAVAGEPGVDWAASAFSGKLVVRAMAADAFHLRRQVMRLLVALRDGPLPRVWQN
ncbi:MAG: urease accessory protein UreD [Rhodobacterales bacterium 32-67-9]|nr:MAG: urease accessory protein UreD [Rhodobacterales bacterium 32-67-9]